MTERSAYDGEDTKDRDPSEQVDIQLSEPSDELIGALGGIEGPVLVLGAGGKMGLHVGAMISRADAAAGREREVLAVSRFSSIHGREAFEKFGVKTLACDLEDDAALEALPDAPNIVFMAGAKFGTSGRSDLLKRMNEDLPKRVAARFPGARILVFSTGCVYSMVPVESGGSREGDATEPPGEYALSCLQREHAFSGASAQFGTRVVLLRLNYSTEFRYGVLVDIAQKVLSGEPVDLTTGWVNVIWQRDAVDQILRAFPLAANPPLILNITGAENLRVRDLAEKFGRIFGIPPVFQGEEGSVCWLNNAAKSHALFGPPPTPVDTIVEWTAGWMKNVGQTFGKPTGFENRSGKF